MSSKASSKASTKGRSTPPAPAAAPAEPAPAPEPEAKTVAPPKEKSVSSTAAPTVATTAAPSGQIAEAYARVQAKVGLALEPVVVKAKDGTVYIQGKVGETLVYIKAKLVALGDTHVVKFVITYANKVNDVVQPRIVYVQAKVDGAITFASTKAQTAKTRALAAYGDATKAVEGFLKTALESLADKYNAGQVKVLSITEPVVIRVKGQYAFVSGKVGDAVVVVKTKRDAAKQAALEQYARAVAKVDSYVAPATAYVAEKTNSLKTKAKSAFEPVVVKIEGGVLYVKGKINDTDVFIRAKLSSAEGWVANLLDKYFTPLKLKVIGGYEYLVGRVGSTIVYIRTEVLNTYSAARGKALAKYTSTLELLDGYTLPVRTRVGEKYDLARTKALAIMDEAKVKAAKAKADMKVVAKDEKFQATAGTAVSGAVALGASAGAAGFMTGGAVGAMVGVVPAIFTFGLSIPIGAAIGAGTGMCVGTAAGGTVGLVGGGAVGYGVQTHKKELGDAASGAISKVGAAKDYVKDTAANSVTYVRTKVLPGTGGTA